MPRTKHSKGFSRHPVIVMDRDDCFGGAVLGLKTKLVNAREITWPNGLLKGQVFLLHKVPGTLSKWQVSHRDTGLALLVQPAPTMQEAMSWASSQLLEWGRQYHQILNNEVPLHSPVTERQMIEISERKERDWGTVKSPIQKILLDDHLAKTLRRTM